MTVCTFERMRVFGFFSSAAVSDHRETGMGVYVCVLALNMALIRLVPEILKKSASWKLEACRHI